MAVDAGAGGDVDEGLGAGAVGDVDDEACSGGEEQGQEDQGEEELQAADSLSGLRPFYGRSAPLPFTLCKVLIRDTLSLG